MSITKKLFFRLVLKSQVRRFSLKVTSTTKLIFVIKYIYSAYIMYISEFFYLKKNCLVLIKVSRFLYFVITADFKICDVIINIAA